MEATERAMHMLRESMSRADAAMPGIAYGTLDAALELLRAAEVIAETTDAPGMDSLLAECKASRERTEIARDIARRLTFASKRPVPATFEESMADRIGSENMDEARAGQ